MLKIAATFCAAVIIAASALSTSADARGFGGGGARMGGFGGARMGGFGGVRMGGFAGPRFGAARFGAARFAGPGRIGFAGPGRMAFAGPGRGAWIGRGAWVGRGAWAGRWAGGGWAGGWRGWTLVALVGCRHWRRTGRRVAVLRRLRLRLLRPVDTGLRMGKHLRLPVQRLLLLTSTDLHH